jgi:Na+-transporting methylmalonyl-CoA/oxaloacetate decarboxylase gamma subunit
MKLKFKQRLSTVVALALIVACASFFAACGMTMGGGGDDSGGAEIADSVAGYDTSYETSDGYEESDNAAAAQDDSGAADSDYEPTALEATQLGDTSSQGADRKITFSASYELETKSYDKDYERLDALIKESGGYIASENSIAYPYALEHREGRSSFLSLKIPVGGYESFLEKLAGIGEVANKSKSSEDLTSEYFDTEARIEMLQMRKERLTEYIKNATKAADIVEFERELSDVLLELDQYEGNKRRLDQLVDYATVEVNLTELITPETIGKDGQPLGDRASDAFKMSVTGVGEFLRNAAVFFAGAAPVIALIIVIVVIIWFIVKLVRRARDKYRAAHPERGAGYQAGAGKGWRRKSKRNKQEVRMPYAADRDEAANRTGDDGPEGGA